MKLIVAITSADRRLRMGHNDGLIGKGSNTRQDHASCRSSSQMITIDTSRAIKSRDGSGKSCHDPVSNRSKGVTEPRQVLQPN